MDTTLTKIEDQDNMITIAEVRREIEHYFTPIGTRLANLENRFTDHEGRMDALSQRVISNHRTMIDTLKTSETHLIGLLHNHIQDELSRYMVLIDEMKNTRVGMESKTSDLSMQLTNIQGKLLMFGATMGSFVVVAQVASIIWSLVK